MGNARRRSEGLIVERLPGELLVYDEGRDEAHCLHGEAAAVFDLLDGTRTNGDLAALASLSETRVEEILSELSARHLLQQDDSGLSRRALIHAGAGVAGAALITSVAAPLPAAAQSPAGCNPGSCDPEGRACQEGCFCFDTDQHGPLCLDFSASAGDCSSGGQGDCPSGTFCVEDECEGEGFNGRCWPACGTAPDLQQSSRRSRSLSSGSWFSRR